MCIMFTILQWLQFNARFIRITYFRPYRNKYSNILALLSIINLNSCTFMQLYLPNQQSKDKQMLQKGLFSRNRELSFLELLHS